jgi:hypothetical protein
VPKRQVVILKTVNPAEEQDDGLPVIGTLSEVLEHFAPFNTAPDKTLGQSKSASTSLTSSGIVLLHGPGMFAEIAALNLDDDVRQVMVTMTDEDFAFPVMLRACRMHHWTMMDPESGQTLKF